MNAISSRVCTAAAVLTTAPDPGAYSGATIDKGETKRGLLVFEVPKSVKTGALRFHVDPPVGALDTIEIRLK